MPKKLNKSSLKEYAEPSSRMSHAITKIATAALTNEVVKNNPLALTYKKLTSIAPIKKMYIKRLPSVNNAAAVSSIAEMDSGTIIDKCNLDNFLMLVIVRTKVIITALVIIRSRTLSRPKIIYTEAIINE